MGGRTAAAIAAAGLALFAAASETGRGGQAGTCELGTADRTRTPSTRCVACHDGSTGPGVEFYMSAQRHAMGHPVEVEYGAAAARQPDRYVPPAALPPDVPLVEGRLACTSCHDGASLDPKRVAIPLRLCQSCHRL